MAIFVTALLAICALGFGTVFWWATSNLDQAAIYPAALIEQMEASTTPEFLPLRDNSSFNGITRQVVSFTVDGLRQYALILTPKGEPVGSGWPVLMFNHGYHPDPAQYGRIADDSSSRPGDYYRGIPQTFAEAGYVVVTPDYRGHNDSEGGEFVKEAVASYWYARDVIGAYKALPSLANLDLKLDLDRVFMLGHSMGAGMTLRVLPALSKGIKAASIWSISLPAGRRASLAQWRYPGLVSEQHLKGLTAPVQIHHAKGDKSTAVANSVGVAERLTGVTATELHLYESDQHLFKGEDYASAVERDLAWFNRF